MKPPNTRFSRFTRFGRYQKVCFFGFDYNLICGNVIKRVELYSNLYLMLIDNNNGLIDKRYITNR